MLPQLDVQPARRRAPAGAEPHLLPLDGHSRWVWRQRTPAERAADLHPVPDAGAGEGVPLQPLPDAAPAHRDRARPVPDGEADQDLVPEPAHEVEEGEQDQGRARVRRR